MGQRRSFHKLDRIVRAILLMCMPIGASGQLSGDWTVTPPPLPETVRPASRNGALNQYVLLGQTATPQALAEIEQIETKWKEARLQAMQPPKEPDGPDADSDGWTDAQERKMGTNPAKADTDGDGLNDFQDPCPDLAHDPALAEDEATQIIQRAVFAYCGLGDAPMTALRRVRYDTKNRQPERRVHLWGISGPVIYAQDAAAPPWVDRVDDHLQWTEPQINADRATIFVRDRHRVQLFHFKKLSSQWYVVGIGWEVVF